MAENFPSERGANWEKGFVQALFDAGTLGAALIDQSNLFRRVGQAFCELLGYEEAELLGRHCDEILHPDDASALVDARSRAWQGKDHAIRLEQRYLHKDGGVVRCLAHFVLARDETGAPLYLIGQFLDLTERKQAEAARHESEQHFLTLAENSPDVIVRYDQQGRRRYVNPAYERATGIPASEAVSDGLRWPDIPREEYEASLRQVMDTGAPAELLMDWSRRDHGTIACHAVQMVAERNTAGEVTGVLAIGHDITALKEAERRLVEAYAQLRRLAVRREEAREEERKRIAREMHDELGQILTGLQLDVSVLSLKFGAENPQLQDHLRGTSELADKAVAVVRDVVTSLRPAALERGIVSALEWLTETFAASTGVHCELHLGDWEIRLDDSRATALFRIVQESLTNVARHAMAERVNIFLGREEGDYLLTVRDNGRGFDPGEQKQSSFGLLGIRERVFMLGGKLTISSAPGWGTSLAVRLPIDGVSREP